jgi:uncharacterized protein (DUF1330 family)
VGGAAARYKAGFEENFLKPTMKDIADHGGKYLAGSYNNTLSLSGAEPPNRVVIVQFANMGAVKEWRDQGAMGHGEHCRQQVRLLSHLRR